MRYIFTLLLFLNCSFAQTQEEALHDAKIRQQARTELLKELQEAQKQKEQQPLLDNLGLSIQKNLIILDTNKTSNFFEKLSNIVEKKLKKMQKNFIKEISDPKKAGIDINSEHINIDMNQSQKYLKELEKKMQDFVKEFDNMAKEFNQPLN